MTFFLINLAYDPAAPQTSKLINFFKSVFANENNYKEILFILGPIYCVLLYNLNTNIYENNSIDMFKNLYKQMKNYHKSLFLGTIYYLLAIGTIVVFILLSSLLNSKVSKTSID